MSKNVDPDAAAALAGLLRASGTRRLTGASPLIELAPGPGAVRDTAEADCAEAPAAAT